MTSQTRKPVWPTLLRHSAMLVLSALFLVPLAAMLVG